jgi:hypothetical protein
MMERTTTATAADLRAEIARHQLQLFIVGGLAGIHPRRLTEILREQRALEPNVAERIMRAIREAAQPERRGR